VGSAHQVNLTEIGGRCPPYVTCKKRGSNALSMDYEVFASFAVQDWVVVNNA